MLSAGVKFRTLRMLSTCHGTPPGQVTLVIRPKECAKSSSAFHEIVVESRASFANLEALLE
jgi:hypothetical protein